MDHIAIEFKDGITSTLQYEVLNQRIEIKQNELQSIKGEDKKAIEDEKKDTVALRQNIAVA